MRVCVAAALIALGIACATRSDREARPVVQTQVVTFPHGALVQYKGHDLGRAPVHIVLPQDENGRLTERAEVRAVPNSNQDTLYAQSRIFDPGTRTDRVPDRIMIDLTLRGTNEAPTNAIITTQVESASAKSSSKRVKPVERSKPTQAVGLDRWNPGQR